MKCLVTAGPTYEPLDAVRRLTNFSTGRLGGELAAFLTDRGHEVTLLVGEQATWPGERRAAQVMEFSTTSNLGNRLRELGTRPADAVFHAAAVSDFRFGKVWSGAELDQTATLPSLNLNDCASPQSGNRTAQPLPDHIGFAKIPSRSGRLVVELRPTLKIIAQLRDWFPKARLVGWKYELDGSRADAIAAAGRQLRECRTDACVVNGCAYGDGFGFVTGTAGCIHLDSVAALYPTLERFALG